jgi:hypothetical protein
VLFKFHKQLISNEQVQKEAKNLKLIKIRIAKHHRKPTQKRNRKNSCKNQKKNFQLSGRTELNEKKESCIKKLNCKQDNKSFKFIHINVSAIVKCFDLLDGQFRYEMRRHRVIIGIFHFARCVKVGEKFIQCLKSKSMKRRREEKKIIRAFHVRQINSTTKKNKQARRKNRNCTNTISMLSVSSLFSC